MKKAIKRIIDKHGVTNAHIFWNVIVLILIYSIQLSSGNDVAMTIQYVFSAISAVFLFVIWFDDVYDTHNGNYRIFSLWFNLGGIIILLFYLLVVCIMIIFSLIFKNIDKFNNWINNK